MYFMVKQQKLRAIKTPFSSLFFLTGKIPSRRRDQPCYMHSFGMSKDFIVILEQPLFVDKTATNGINLHHHLKWKAHLPVS